ncbi:MAG: bifunctional hydroxymethylpyrimidine kinase/phosphomethylpyrimidine kinase [Methanobacterium sp.]|nr:bifunctional hydroxymethylpyrimidine kinase/phosphomethylpyrimidine kinase [Methanobacterium sp.]
MTVLSIAGFDPSGGAGILNDVKTFHALQEYGTAVITALTTQNIRRVEEILPLEVEFVEKQIDIILEEEKIVHAKTGMLYSPDIIKAVAGKVEEYELKVVVDPVMIAGSGDPLSKSSMVHALKKHLLPLAQLTTPNIFEAQALSGMELKNREDVIGAAIKIGEICPVVVTGGHLNGTDVLFKNSIEVMEGELLDTENVHGSGCTFSAACTVYLNRGFSIEDSILKAGEFTKKSIKYGLKGTLNQFWDYK